MLKITICFFDYSGVEGTSPTHCYTHIAAMIEEEKNKEEKPIIVNFADERFTTNITAAFMNQQTDNKITLYSNKNIDDFDQLFKKNFTQASYGFYNNGADAVNFVLDYFFPDASQPQCWYNFLKIMCCLPAAFCCGFICLPAAPFGISTPLSVMDKAHNIQLDQQAKLHNAQKNVSHFSFLNKSVEESQNNLEEKLITPKKNQDNYNTFSPPRF